jgi:disulfide bond formation protein DsbB
MNRFFALLAIVAVAGTVVVALAALVPARPLRRFRDDLGLVALPLAWIVATVATLGSLYYSEVAGFTPCTLCWYQRIAMYPLAVVLGIAARGRDDSVRRYVLPLAAIGAAVSLYHIQLQRFPEQSTFCAVDAPCTVIEVQEFGFVTIPTMALAGFAAVIALTVVARQPAVEEPVHPHRADAPTAAPPEEVLTP